MEWFVCTVLINWKVLLSPWKCDAVVLQQTQVDNGLWIWKDKANGTYEYIFTHVDYFTIVSRNP